MKTDQDNPPPKTKRKTRRNFAREVERVSAYVDVMARVKAEPIEGLPPELARFIEGQQKAYKDIAAFIREMATGVK